MPPASSSRPMEAATARLPELRQAALAAPKDVGLLCRLAAACLDLNRPHDAVRALHRASHLGPEDAAVLLQLGLSLERAWMLRDALAAVRRASAIAPADREIQAALHRLEAELPDEDPGRLHNAASLWSIRLPRPLLLGSGVVALTVTLLSSGSSRGRGRVVKPPPVKQTPRLMMPPVVRTTPRVLLPPVAGRGSGGAVGSQAFTWRPPSLPDSPFPSNGPGGGSLTAIPDKPDAASGEPAMDPQLRVETVRQWVVGDYGGAAGKLAFEVYVQNLALDRPLHAELWVAMRGFRVAPRGEDDERARDELTAYHFARGTTLGPLLPAQKVPVRFTVSCPAADEIRNFPGGWRLLSPAPLTTEVLAVRPR